MTIKGDPNFKKTVGIMKPGEKGFTCPWALSFGLNGTAYFNTSFSVASKPDPNGGERIMPVTRTGPGEADYEIDVNFEYDRGKNGRYEWVKSRYPFASDAEAHNSVELSVNGWALSQRREKNLQTAPEIAKQIRLYLTQRRARNQELLRQQHPKTWALRKRLDRAVVDEEYGLAANLRDQIKDSSEPFE